MSRKNVKQKSLMLLGLCTITLFTACVNKIDSESPSGTVPINFSMKVSNTQTRATNTAFDKGDRVGLFATFSSQTISEERYIDNLKLEYGRDATFIPEKVVFYPVGDINLDFTCYYPYQPTGISTNSSIIPISVYSDQSDATRRSQSDFLLAKSTNIASSEKPVELEFCHKLIKLQITLTPKEGENINELLKADPYIIATGFKTKANYNLDTNEITDVNEEVDIIPYGTWSIKNGKLVGKEIIIIPQTINSETQSFVMDWNGQIYTCKMPELTLEGSTQCALDITAMQTTSHILAGIIGTIKDWTTVEGKETDNNDKTTAVHIAALSFAQSDIYRVYSKGKAIAEICKEYLKSEDINSKAIISYPVNSDEQSDLSKGTVLRLIDDERNINGGMINWDMANNTFSYTTGNSTPIDVFYFTETGEVLLEKPRNSIDINIISHTIRDLRNGSIKQYPIVKIGMQYWMKENLQATTYRDDTTIKRITEFGHGAGYFHSTEQETYFYTGDALLTKELAPEQWRIPNMKDWEVLIKYTNNTAIFLEAGKWTTNDGIYTATNETGFNAIPYGLYSGKDGKTTLANAGSSAGYWISGDSQTTLADKIILLTSLKDDAQLIDCNPESNALFVRCIKE